jgi:hypothetical protein
VVVGAHIHERLKQEFLKGVRKVVDGEAQQHSLELAEARLDTQRRQRPRLEIHVVSRVDLLMVNKEIKINIYEKKEEIARKIEEYK